METVPKSSVLQIPLEKIVSEGASQRDRILQEVMDKLFEGLPEGNDHSCDFVLSDGVKCWVKKFSAPKIRTDGTLSYGFDVKLSGEEKLSHLEFFVRCTGWERNLTAAPEDAAPT